MWSWRFRAREWLARSWLVVPSAYVVAALALGHLIPDIESTDGTLLGLKLSDEAAQDILAAIAGGMIAFTGIVVSVAVVVVQFGASQYTPRLVLRFRRDPVVKHALGIFIAPALYALVSLREVGRSDKVAANLTVAVGVVLVLVALLSFFLLVGRLLDLLRPRRLYAQLVEAGGRAVADVYPASSAVKRTPSEPLPPATETVAYDGPSGVISALDRSRLVLAATAAETTIELLWAVGSSLHPGAPLYRIRGAASRVSHDLLVRSVIVSEERTITQDPAFAIRTIVDIAIRALSPAVNDPTTAVQALDALESLLHTVAGRDLEGGRLFDARGELRVVYPVAGWQELVRLAFTEIRRYGADSPQVARRLRSLLDSMLERTSADRHAAVEEQLALLDGALVRAYEDPAERALAATPDHLGLGGPESADDPSG